MTDTRTFPTLHVASAITGIGMCLGLKYSNIHEIASHLFGAPVWTHELGHSRTIEAYAAEGYRQFPDMPTKEEAKADWRKAAQKAIAAYGETVTVARGTSIRREDPISTLASMMQPEKEDRQP